MTQVTMGYFAVLGRRVREQVGIHMRGCTGDVLTQTVLGVSSSN